MPLGRPFGTSLQFQKHQVLLAVARLQTEIHNTLQVRGDVLTARQAVHGGNFTLAAGDVALMDLDGVTAASKVAYHVVCEKTVWPHMTFWTHVHGCMYG